MSVLDGPGNFHVPRAPNGCLTLPPCESSTLVLILNESCSSSSSSPLEMKPSRSLSLPIESLGRLSSRIELPLLMLCSKNIVHCVRESGKAQTGVIRTVDKLDTHENARRAFDRRRPMPIALVTISIHQSSCFSFSGMKTQVLEGVTISNLPRSPRCTAVATVRST